MRTWDRTPLTERYGSPPRRINVNLTESTADDVRRMAAEDAVSVSELVRDLIADESARRAARQMEDQWTTST